MCCNTPTPTIEKQYLYSFHYFFTKKKYSFMFRLMEISLLSQNRSTNFPPFHHPTGVFELERGLSGEILSFCTSHETICHHSLMMLNISFTFWKITKPNLTKLLHHHLAIMALIIVSKPHQSIKKICLIIFLVRWFLAMREGEKIWKKRIIQFFHANLNTNHRGNKRRVDEQTEKICFWGFDLVFG